MLFLAKCKFVNLEKLVIDGSTATSANQDKWNVGNFAHAYNDAPIATSLQMWAGREMLATSQILSQTEE